MRPRRAIAALPLIALAPISMLACSDDKNDAVASTQASSESPIGATDTGGSAVDTGSDATEGPTLAEVVRATLAHGSARYLMATDRDATVDDLVAGLMDGAGAPGDSGSDTTASEGTESSAADTTTGGSDTTSLGTTAGSDTTSADSTGSSDAAATGGCDVPPGDRAEGAADVDQQLHCVVLPDGTQVVIDGRDIYLGVDGAWSVTTVQFDSALAQLDADQLMALHDPTAVLASIVGERGGMGGDGDTSSSSSVADTVSEGSTETSSGGSVAESSGETLTGDSTGSSSTGDASGAGEVHGTSGPNGLEYQVTLQVSAIADPFVVALAQRAGAQSVVVHVFADETGQSVQALSYEFPQAATTTGGATGNGTGGATETTAPGSETTNGSPQNPAGGGNGSTTSAASSLPDSGSTSLPASTFEDIPTVAVAFTSFSDAVDIQLPGEPEALNLGDLGASLEVDLSPGQG